VITTGIGLGYPAITTQLLLRDNTEVLLTPSQVSWFASVTAIACPFGGPISGFLTDKIGRRSTLVVVSAIAFISWIIIGFSSQVDSQLFFIQLMIGRSLIGLCIGMITTPAVMYSSEICHPNLRSRLTILSTPFFMAFGVVVAYFLGYLIPVSLNPLS
jgi:MFS family permease